MRPVVLLWGSRNVPPGAEDQSALEGQQVTKINHAQRPVKSFILRLQVGALPALGEQMIDALALFHQQCWVARMALALRQFLLCSLNLPRKLLAPKTRRGLAVGILIEFPRDQLKHV